MLWVVFIARDSFVSVSFGNMCEIHPRGPLVLTWCSMSIVRSTSFSLFFFDFKWNKYNQTSRWKTKENKRFRKLHLNERMLVTFVAFASLSHLFIFINITSFISLSQKGPKNYASVSRVWNFPRKQEVAGFIHDPLRTCMR